MVMALIVFRHTTATTVTVDIHITPISTTTGNMEIIIISHITLPIHMDITEDIIQVR